MSVALVSIPPDDGRPRLFCFHYAGSGASSYGPWVRELADVVNVCRVQLPGREGRAAEPRERELAPLAVDLARELAPFVDDRTVFYGHSMGALVAYAVACELGRAGPKVLIVGAYPAPHLPAPLAAADDRPNDELVAVLQVLGAFPRELLSEPRWLEVFLDILRDDIRLCRSYQRRPEPPLACPIVALAGRDDPLVSVADVAAWRHHAGDDFELRLLDGGHFFVRDASVKAIVRRVITELD
jgi:surfactin synthase thioesterase subunit